MDCLRTKILSATTVEYAQIYCLVQDILFILDDKYQFYNTKLSLIGHCFCTICTLAVASSVILNYSNLSQFIYIS